jgi:hypothetical protein
MRLTGWRVAMWPLGGEARVVRHSPRVRRMRRVLGSRGSIWLGGDEPARPRHARPLARVRLLNPAHILTVHVIRHAPGEHQYAHGPNTR